MKRNLQYVAPALARTMFAGSGTRVQTPGGVAPAACYYVDGSDDFHFI